eukprot:4980569-Pyramimonas_sp.AAC.1
MFCFLPTSDVRREGGRRERGEARKPPAGGCSFANPPGGLQTKKRGHLHPGPDRRRRAGGASHSGSSPLQPLWKFSQQ